MLNLEYLANLQERYRAELDAAVQPFTLAGRTLGRAGEPALMGVINLSPDSWYRESVCLSADAAIARGQVLAAQGAAVVDLGAESTLAAARRADDALQTSLLLPVLRALRAADIVVSVETYQPAVARAVLAAGANVLNLTGSEQSGDMYRMVADHGAAVIICYVQGPHVRAVADFDFGSDPVGLMEDYFAREIETARRHGVERILIDPGLGFYYRNLQDSAVRIRHQMTVFLNTFRLRRLGCPICHALPHAFEFFRDEVRCAEPFFAVLALLGRTDLLRTHEVPRVRAVLETMRSF